MSVSGRLLLPTESIVFDNSPREDCRHLQIATWCFEQRKSLSKVASMGWLWVDAEQRPLARPPASTPSSPVSPPVSKTYNQNDSPLTKSQPGCPMHKKPSSPAALVTEPSNPCPYTPPSSQTSSTFSKLNPLNYMPTMIPNTPSSSQTTTLPLDREPSTIPRGDGSGTTWDYPSPQQMYNAMLKKGYADTPAAHVPAMVAVHNFLNEGAWDEIREWERRFGNGLAEGWRLSRRGEENARMMRTPTTEDSEPALVRFQGRPDEPSPKARLLRVAGWCFPETFGSLPPFDRHDWFVRRRSSVGSAVQESEVRYVIDYYSGPPEPSGEPVFYLDVRPAVDSPTAAAERVLRWWGEVWWRAKGGSVAESSGQS